MLFFKMSATTGQWQMALDLMEEMRERSLRPSVVTYTTAIAACGYWGQVSRALELLKEMEADGVRPNRWCYTTAIWCCKKAGRLEDAQSLLSEMKAKGFVSQEADQIMTDMRSRNDHHHDSEESAIVESIVAQASGSGPRS